MNKHQQRILSILCVLALLWSGMPMTAALAEEPTAHLGELMFQIDGPDPSMPITVSYSDFVEGKFELDDLVPGEYTVKEMNADELIPDYHLLEDSVTEAIITVSEDGTAEMSLINRYGPGSGKETAKPDGTDIPGPSVTPTTPTVPPTPTRTPGGGGYNPPTQPTPTPTEKPQETPTPIPEPEFVDIPVTKTWVDNNNKDGNRPSSVTIHLFADGQEIQSATLSDGNGWANVFAQLPKTNDAGAAISYTISEDPVEWYDSTINGYNVTNTYHPEVTSVSVVKIWDDNNNAAGMRPQSIHATLSNGTVVVLNAGNGWSATVDNLPTKVNGQPAVYTWHEQEVLGYTLTSVSIQGNMTILTNSFRTRPEPPPGRRLPPVPGTPLEEFDDMETPLGVEVMINHVGDCFD